MSFYSDPKYSKIIFAIEPVDIMILASYAAANILSGVLAYRWARATVQHKCAPEAPIASADKIVCNENNRIDVL